MKKKIKLIHDYRTLETSMEKQSEIQLTKEEFKKIMKKGHEEEKKMRTTDFKTIKKDISHQLDLLEKNTIEYDEDKTRKTKKAIGKLMLDVINEDFLEKEYNVPSQKKWMQHLRNIRKWKMYQRGVQREYNDY